MQTGGLPPSAFAGAGRSTGGTVGAMREPVTSALEASGASAGVTFTVLGVVAISLAAFWCWSLIDAMSWPRSTWHAADLSRARWVVRILFLGLIGTFFYLRAPRRELRAAYRVIRRGGTSQVASSPPVSE